MKIIHRLDQKHKRRSKDVEDDWKIMKKALLSQKT